MIPMTIAYPLYNFLIDCPMYMERYAEDEAAGKVYFDFLPGLVDAAVTRNPTHHLEDWQVGWAVGWAVGWVVGLGGRNSYPHALA